MDPKDDLRDNKTETKLYYIQGHGLEGWKCRGSLWQGGNCEQREREVNAKWGKVDRR